MRFKQKCEHSWFSQHFNLNFPEQIQQQKGQPTRTCKKTNHKCELKTERFDRGTGKKVLEHRVDFRKNRDNWRLIRSFSQACY